jgi:hypothetical protein
MRMFLPAALFAVVALSGCASRQPSTGGIAPPKSAPVALGNSNRFEMIQNGRQMSADDFDAWMKARGIRVAKGPQRARTQVRADAPKPKAKPQPKRR